MLQKAGVRLECKRTSDAGAGTCDATDDCQPGTPPTTNDGVACTDDSCDTLLIHTPSGKKSDERLYDDPARYDWSCSSASSSRAARESAAPEQGNTPPLGSRAEQNAAIRLGHSR